MLTVLAIAAVVVAVLWVVWRRKKVSAFDFHSFKELQEKEKEENEYAASSGADDGSAAAVVAVETTNEYQSGPEWMSQEEATPTENSGSEALL